MFKGIPYPFKTYFKVIESVLRYKLEVQKAKGRTINDLGGGSGKSGKKTQLLLA